MKFSNPLFRILYDNFGYFLSLTSFERAVDENGRRMRARISEFVQKRKSGELKSDVEGNADLLSLFFESPDVFTDSVIVDELIDFVNAASGTT